MALNTEMPAWLVEQDHWIKGISDRGVSELFAGAQAVQQISAAALAIQAKKNDLEVQPQMNMLKLQDMQLKVQDQKDTMADIGADQKKAADWQTAKQTDPTAPEPAWQSEKYQQMSWQRARQQDALDIKKLGIQNQLAEAQAKEETRRQFIVTQKNEAAIKLDQKNQQLEIQRQALAARKAGTVGQAPVGVKLTAAMQSELDLAAQADTPELKAFHEKNAANYEAMITKLGQFAPAKPIAGCNESKQVNAAGVVTNITRVPIVAPVTPTSKTPVITDKSGKKWVYKGTMTDPTKDKDPSHWSPQ